MKSHASMPESARTVIFARMNEASNSEKKLLQLLAQSSVFESIELDDNDWPILIKEGLLANVEFTSYRETRDRLKRHYNNIADSAEKLAQMIARTPDVATADIPLFIMAKPEGAPDIPDDEGLIALLENLAYIARNMHMDIGPIGAAMKSRKKTAKTAFLRAYGFRLRSEGINFTPNVMNAMAGIASIVLQDQDIDVSYDDVRKTIGKADQWPPF